MSKKIKLTAILLSLIVTALFLTSCGASVSNDSYAYAVKDEAEYEIVAESAPASAGYGNYSKSTTADKVFADAEAGEDITADTVLKEKSDRKIIYSSWAEVETKEYDKTVNALKALCSKYSAYFESSDSYGSRIDRDSERHSNYTIRIPVDNYPAFVNEVDGIGTIVNSGENNRDVTDQYYDTEARLESAELREERVLILLENAGSLDDILALERELSDIRYEIESYTGSLRKYDSLINYATFTLTVNEVIEYTTPAVTPRTFGEEVSQSFKSGLDNFIEGWQNFVIGLSYNLFNIITYLAVLAVLAVIAIVLVKKSKKKSAPVINKPEDTDKKENE